MTKYQYTGERLGNYNLLRLLGDAGSTVVYLGKHIHHNTPVAIKFMKGRGTVNEVAKFFSQARMLTKLQHPHIVPILDFGVHNGIGYLVMDYIPNGHLRQRHPKGTCISLETTVSYVKQVASALQYIHEQHLVHRDVKPHNMLLAADNKLMLSDFGIAVISHSVDPSQSETNEFEGTVLYAAPEQLQGQPQCASDQYALGVVTYEWLCGNWPFLGTFDEIAHQHIVDDPPSFQEQGLVVPPIVEQVVMKALEKEPENRFQNVETFAIALEQAARIARTFPVAAAKPVTITADAQTDKDVEIDTTLAEIEEATDSDITLAGITETIDVRNMAAKRLSVLVNAMAHNNHDVATDGADVTETMNLKDVTATASARNTITPPSPPQQNRRQFMSPLPFPKKIR